MIFVYQTFITILLIISPIIVFIRILNKKEDKKRFIEKFSIPSKKKIAGKLIWFHGASVGEMKSIIPIIKIYEKKKSISQILITSSTISSSRVFEKYKFKKTVHQFYPIDHIFFNKRFLSHWKPNLAIFIESEIWPSMYDEIYKSNIPLILLNARLTNKTFKNWIKIKFFSKLIFEKIKIAFPQNLETKNYLKRLNVKKINLIGNLKFAQDEDENQFKISNELKSKFIKKKIWIASSTHNKEEIFCAKTHLKLQKKINNLITIIIPRHIHRTNEIKKEIEKLKLKVALHSDKPKDLENTNIYIVDAFGETGKFHSIGASVFLGGSIIERGGQNPLEAARYGARILHGPNIDNFKDVYKLLKVLKVSKKIYKPDQLASSIIFKKNRKIGVKIKNIGEKILKKTIKELDNLIKNEFKKT